MGDFRHIGGRRYEVLRPIRAEVRSTTSALFLEVPAGFRFDLSAPSWAHWLIDPHDPRYLRAAALHDWALHVLEWPRELAAAPFGWALRRAGVSRFKRLVMVLAVIIWRWK